MKICELRKILEKFGDDDEIIVEHNINKLYVQEDLLMGRREVDIKGKDYCILTTDCDSIRGVWQA